MKIENGKEEDIGKLFSLVITGIIVYFLLDFVAQILPPHYSPVSQAESDLAVGKYGLIMTINFLNRGLLSLLFVFAFFRTLKLAVIPRSSFKIGTSLLIAWAFGSIALAIFPTDIPPSNLSLDGGIHLVVAIVAFICGAFGTVAISVQLGQYNAFEKLRKFALPLSAFVICCWAFEFALPFIAPHLNSQIGGLTERVFLASVLIWFGFASYLAKNVRLVKFNKLVFEPKQ